MGENFGPVLNVPKENAEKFWTWGSESFTLNEWDVRQSVMAERWRTFSLRFTYWSLLNQICIIWVYLLTGSSWQKCVLKKNTNFGDCNYAAVKFLMISIPDCCIYLPKEKTVAGQRQEGQKDDTPIYPAVFCYMCPPSFPHCEFLLYFCTLSQTSLAKHTATHPSLNPNSTPPSF